MKINERDEALLDQSFVKYSKYENGYLKRLVETHFDEKIDKTSLDLQEIFRLVFMILFTYRIFKVLRVTEDNIIVVYYGSPWHILGGSRFHNEISFLLWTINYFALYTFLHNRQSKHYKWLEVFAFLSRSTPYQKIGMSDEKTAIKFLKNSKIVLKCCHYFVNYITYGCFMIALVAFLLDYSLKDFLIFGISWAVFIAIWCYIACEAVYWMPGYYCIICYYLRLRFDSIDRRLRYMSVPNRYPLIVNEFMIKRYLREHNNLCVQYKVYNKYWKNYLTVFYTIYVIIICFLMYLIFIAPVKWFLQIEYSIILWAHIMLVLTVTYSASTVSHANKNLSKVLKLISVRISFPARIKLKLLNYIEKLDNYKIGFTFADDQLIIRKTFEYVIYYFSSLFFLLVEHSLKAKD